MKNVRVPLLLVSAVMALASCKKEEPLTQAGDINLAGCEVTAGLTAAQAEEVDCAPEKEAVAPVAQGAAATDDQVIKEALDRQAFIYEQAEEDAEARRSTTRDLNGDGVDDLTVVYVLTATNGGNGYATHLAAFVREDSGLKFASSIPVTGYGQAVKDFAVVNGVLTLTALVAGPGDGTCCPSLEQVRRFALVDGEWKEVSQPM